MIAFDEDTRVKFPATIQFMRLGYEYQSLKDVDLHKETRIAINRFKPALERINGRSFSDEEVQTILDEIHAVIRYDDLGCTFYRWLVNPIEKPVLIDFEHIENNDFAVLNELTFGKDGSESDKKGSFRPDITVLINGIPLAFLEVKSSNNEGGIQAEFNRMLDKRLENPDYKKFFNMLQIVAFSNNMEYENDDAITAEDVKAGSFYTTPNGFKTTFSFFREERPKTTGFLEVSLDKIKWILKDNNCDPSEADSSEFKSNLSQYRPCNRFVTSIFEKERVVFFLRYGIIYVDAAVPQKHIMRYPQFFASKALLERLESGGKSGIIWHTQGSGKTELAAFSARILRDYYAKKSVIARFYYVVDRLDLLTQVCAEMANRNLNVIRVNSRNEFEEELNKSVSHHAAPNTDGEITVVNIQKFDDEMPVVQNDYNANVQRVIFVDEAHRSYRKNGEYFKNLLLVDQNAIFVALTGTPLLSRQERSNLKFGGYIHKYFYDKSIADGYTLRIKKESVETKARAEIRKNLELENPRVSKSDATESLPYIDALCRYVEEDFTNFRSVNDDDTIGGMIVCSSNKQAKLIRDWFIEHSQLEVGLVISDEEISAKMNKDVQLSFKNKLEPDLLIVHQMLTTGYDVARLKKMYLLRNSKEHTLLQTISRVNRPYRSLKGKTYRFGYIVDFVDISEEYDRTIEMYMKEIKADFDDEGEEDGLSGIIVGPEDINAKYQKLREELDDIIDLDNLEKFDRRLNNFTKEVLLNIRRLLNDIKECHVEFKLSHADDYAAQIDVNRIKKALNIVQKRIDFINLSSKPTELLGILSRDEVVEIIYEFLKTKTEILDMSLLPEAAIEIEESGDYRIMATLVSKICAEFKRNLNPDQIEIVKLDEVLRKLFEKMNIDNLVEINGELRFVLEEAKRVNEKNEQTAERYGGDYAYAKTYTDALEKRPDLDPEDVARALDIVYNATKEIRSSNVLFLQRREVFVSSLKEMVVPTLVLENLFEESTWLDWFDGLLKDLYTNLKNIY